MSKGKLTFIILGTLNVILILIYLIIIFTVDKTRKEAEYNKKLEDPSAIAIKGFVKSVNDNYIEVKGNAFDKLKYTDMKIVIEDNTKIFVNDKEKKSEIGVGDLVEVYLKKQIIKNPPVSGIAYSINIITEKNNNYNNYLAKMALYYLEADTQSKLILNPVIIPLNIDNSYLIKDKNNNEVDIKNINVYQIKFKLNDDEIDCINIYISKENKIVLGTMTELKKEY